jgi:hypothetical protein
MPRRKLRVVLASLAVVVAAGAVVPWPRPDRITQDSYDRIQEGITRNAGNSTVWDGCAEEMRNGRGEASGISGPLAGYCAEGSRGVV